MSDDLEHPRLDRPGPRTMSGHSREYILDRLERGGYHGLIAAIHAGRVSAHTAAIQMGWIIRPKRLGTGSSNAEKRRRLELQALIREGLFNAPQRG
jgi:hypothetical protein